MNICCVCRILLPVKSSLQSSVSGALRLMGGDVEFVRIRYEMQMACYSRSFTLLYFILISYVIIHRYSGRDIIFIFFT